LWLGRVLPEVDLLTPSLPELADMLRCPPVTDRAELRAISQRMLAMGCAAAIKLGEGGLYLAARGDAGRIASARLPANWLGVDHVEPCFVVDVANATGAGDSTIAGLLVGTELGLNAREAAALATGSGASRCAAGSARRMESAEAITRRIAKNWTKRRSAFESQARYRRETENRRRPAT